MKVTYTDFVSSVICGELDSTLDRMIETIRCRQELLKDKQAQMLRCTIKVGDTVYFSKTCRPTYLRGVKATVRKFNPKKIVVDLFQPAGRFHKGIICPPTLLTTIAP